MASTSEIKKTNRILRGTVVKTAMTKTIVVQVNTMKKHPKYRKSYRVSRKYYVHDTKGEVKKGDVVDFTACRPLSATKRWRLIGKVAIA